MVLKTQCCPHFFPRVLQVIVAVLLDMVCWEVREVSVTQGTAAVPSEWLKLCSCTAELLMYSSRNCLTW